ncbi:uncharacterized protein LOC109605073 [Aethina tumida]|uniref:uncharacterized protein LOC109605073 n=1 Tax=Aethina tumida TaxID=116153 RepID=UPI00096B3001|nr:uncharacterized protein LOC109605073 [Aethina tumida]
MNKYAVLVFALVLAYATAELIKPITDAEKQALKNAHEKCQADPATAVEKGAMKLIHEGKAAEVKNLKPHILCMAKTNKIINEDGKINVEFLKSKWAEHYDAADLAKLEPCLVEKDTPENTAAHLAKCQHEAVGSILHHVHH